MQNPTALWRSFTAAPHRMFFFGGAVQSLLTLLWWLIDLGGRYGGFYAPIAWTLSPVDAHALLMVYGFFPFFIFGFLMTTYPRWMNGEEVTRAHYVAAFLLLAAGAMLLYVGLVTHGNMLKLALILYLAGWGTALYALLRVYVRARHPDKRHTAITTTVLALGWVLLAGVLANDARWLAFARLAGIWLFLLPVFFAVSHRMIPFFSANALPDYRMVRPDWPLMLMPLSALLHVTLESLGLPGWTWLVDLPMAAGAIYLSVAWRLRASLSVPLLAMLHIGFAWLGLALLLYAVQSLALLLTGVLALGKAPLHALAIGYFTSMLLAMATRVTLGHAGKPLQVDRLTWGIFLAFQSVAMLRIVAELPGIAPALRGNLYLAAALVWLACFALWSRTYGRIYWQPRADGKSG